MTEKYTDEWYAARAKLRDGFHALSPSEVDQLLDQATFEDGYEFSWHELDGAYQTTRLKGVFDDRLTITLIDDFGGEGSGDEAWKIVRITAVSGDGDNVAGKFYKKPGYHQSYDGTYYDGDLFEVEPVTETVTVWRKVESR